jgi:hypothetical protein
MFRIDSVMTLSREPLRDDWPSLAASESDVKRQPSSSPNFLVSYKPPRAPVSPLRPGAYGPMAQCGAPGPDVREQPAHRRRGGAGPSCYEGAVYRWGGSGPVRTPSPSRAPPSLSRAVRPAPSGEPGLGEGGPQLRPTGARRIGRSPCRPAEPPGGAAGLQRRLGADLTRIRVRFRRADSDDRGRGPGKAVSLRAIQRLASADCGSVSIPGNTQ